MILRVLALLGFASISGCQFIKWITSTPEDIPIYRLSSWLKTGNDSVDIDFMPDTSGLGKLLSYGVGASYRLEGNRIIIRCFAMRTSGPTIFLTSGVSVKGLSNQTYVVADSYTKKDLGTLDFTKSGGNFGANPTVSETPLQFIKE
jgi:hypothetical protein